MTGAVASKTVTAEVEQASECVVEAWSMLENRRFWRLALSTSLSSDGCSGWSAVVGEGKR